MPEKNSYTYLLKTISALFILLLMFVPVIYGQNSFQDTIHYNQSADSIIAMYKNAVKENLRLYNGSEYQYAGHNVKGFPYFNSPDMQTGSIYYDGNLYNNVSMYYDLVNNELVISDYTKNYPVKLVTNKIKYFVIDGYKFVNPAMYDSLPFSSIPDFYEELYNKKTAVFAKKKKQLQETTSTEGSEAFYKDYNRYFIYRNKKQYEVANENAVLNVFNKRRSEMKKFMRTNKISFKKDFENALVKTTQYFDQIEN